MLSENQRYFVRVRQISPKLGGQYRRIPERERRCLWFDWFQSTDGLDSLGWQVPVLKYRPGMFQNIWKFGMRFRDFSL